MTSKLHELVERVKKESAWKSSPAYELAQFFETTLTNAGFVMSAKNRAKTEETAVRLTAIAGYNPDDWRACIRWAFSQDRLEDEFWAKVVVSNLGTVEKMFNQWKQKHLAAKTNGRQRQSNRQRYTSYEDGSPK